MFRPPPNYKWQQKVRAYENKFRRKVPQWVFTLPLDDAARLLSSCVFLNYKLPLRFLIAGEILDGYGGLWTHQRNQWDLVPKIPSKQYLSK